MERKDGRKGEEREGKGRGGCEEREGNGWRRMRGGTIMDFIGQERM